jgi:hypothetical protein
LRDGDDDLNVRKIEAWYRQWSLPEDRTSRPRARRRSFRHAVKSGHCWINGLGVR